LKEVKVVLKRDDPFKTAVTLQTQATKIETPLVSKELKVLLPGYMAPQNNSNVNINQKRKSTEPNQVIIQIIFQLKNIC
jgi:hypothetical protein